MNGYLDDFEQWFADALGRSLPVMVGGLLLIATILPWTGYWRIIAAAWFVFGVVRVFAWGATHWARDNPPDFA